MARSGASVIWFDVSATMFWLRPPSGTVRVQIEVCRQLRDSGVDIGLCVYRSGSFMRVDDQAFDAHVQALSASAERMPEGANAAPSSVLYRGYTWLRKRAPTSARPLLSRLVGLAVRLRIPVDRLVGRRLQSTGLSGPLTCRMQAGDSFVSLSADWVPEDKIPRIAALRRDGVRTVLCCYDMIPALFPHLCYQPTVERFPAYLAGMADAADMVLCISARTQSDLQAYFHDAGATLPPTAILHLGSDIPGLTAQAGTLAKAIGGDFILYVSTIERRKNHQILYKAYVTMREKLGARPPVCVLVGATGWGVEDFLADIELDPRVKGDFLLLSRVSDDQLQWLYEHCLFTVFPSLYEGWGLPVAESLSNGKFVLASATSSMPEVGGSYAEYLEPWNVGQWAEKIQLYSQDRVLLAEREALIRAEYQPWSWRQTGDDVLMAAGAGTAPPVSAAADQTPR
jgi:glycosyltransferase involved in cell wall biosynthesis